MSNGGRESGRECEHGKSKKKSDDFAQAIAKIAVAQVCESEGFQSFQQSALNTLSDVTVRYIREIGKSANFYANLAGIVREITQYVGDAEEIPFPYSIPSFPIIKDRNPILSFAQVTEVSPSEHIPSWLPAFPDPQICTRSPSRKGREADTPFDKTEPSKEQRKVETTLLNLQQQLACNGSEVPTAVDPGDAAKAKQAAESNPFLAAPLRIGEKEVSSVVLPPKLLDEAAANNSAVVQNHVSVLETFAPAIEAMKNTLCDSEEDGKKVLLNTRSTVQFKFGIGKKSSGTSSIRNEGIGKINSWFGDTNEKDNKKRRAEQILKESIENPQELAQL
ncbi:hypothetical protein CsSME_00004111 [Camellia sinensis var. sinensis]